MNRILALLILGAFGLTNQSTAQSLLSSEIGYYGGTNYSHGGTIGFEYEKYYSDNFSLPLRSSVGFLSNPDFNSLSLEIHKGFRKYFNSGLFLEQYLGLGVMANYYKIESIWYYDKYLSVVRYKKGANLGFMPSVTFGLGYKFGD